MKLPSLSSLSLLALCTLPIIEASTTTTTSTSSASTTPLPRKGRKGYANFYAYNDSDRMSNRRRTFWGRTSHTKENDDIHQHAYTTITMTQHVIPRVFTTAPSPTPPIKKCKKFYKAPSKGTDNRRHYGRRRRGTRDRRHLAVPGEIYTTQEPLIIYEDGYNYQDSESLRARGAPSKGSGLNMAPSKGSGSPSKGKQPNIIWIDECEQPSASPSSSPKPSYHPTSSPSYPPTNHPTHSPSSRPTLSSRPSHVPSPVPTSSPSISLAPSTSHAPTVSEYPTNKPTMSFSPGCQALRDGEVYGVGEEANEEYYYQLVTTVGANMTQVLGQLDVALRKAIGFDLVYCGEKAKDVYGTGTGNEGRSRSRALKSSMINGVDFHTTRTHINDDINANGRALRIDGLDMEGPDEAVGDDHTCDDILDVPEGRECNVYKGSFKVYYREGTYTELEAKQKVLVELRNTMDLEEPKQNMLAEVDDAWDIGYGDGVKAKKRQETPDGAVIGGGDSAVKGGLTGIGIAMVASASVIGVLFLFAVTRRREHSKLQVMEQIIEDDASIFNKSFGNAMSTDGTEIAAGSDKMAYVLGDCDSVYSGMDDVFMTDAKAAERKRLYGMGSRSHPLGPRENDLGLRGSSLNVHTCTSATCPICAREANSPTFVPTDLGPGRNNVCTPVYSDTVDVDMAERPYASPNTVEM